MRSFTGTPRTSRVPQTRAEIGNIAWPRAELLEIARLLDHLAPPSAHDPERDFELRRGAIDRAN
jgi:hypothetical protein